MYLLEWAWQLHENKCETELVDANLPEFDVDEVKKVTRIALLCTQTSPALRPSMSRVIAMLTGDAGVATVTSKPGYLTDWKFKDTTTFMTDHSSQMHNSSVSTSTVVDTNCPPSGDDTPMLRDVIGEGR
ncbi:hypothetical protein RND71_037565 [Anisodus tanguticus]|uniref:Uncharacterized protein n=1 Tax=Anisodus tanguticus TaxID=243964 RepID=A0AAE1QYY5_9SOLA|nr:hypothetical protein RND71_037565 [Anisodus tanguticus]